MENWTDKLRGWDLLLMGLNSVHSFSLGMYIVGAID